MGVVHTAKFDTFLAALPISFNDPMSWPTDTFAFNEVSLKLDFEFWWKSPFRASVSHTHRLLIRGKSNGVKDNSFFTWPKTIVLLSWPMWFYGPISYAENAFHHHTTPWESFEALPFAVQFFPLKITLPGAAALVHTQTTLSAGFFL